MTAARRGILAGLIAAAVAVLVWPQPRRRAGWWNKQRGVISDGWLIALGVLLLLELVVAGIGMVNSAFKQAENRGYERGKAEVTAKWETANREAREKQAEQRRKDEAIVAAEVKQRQEAEGKAADYHAKWQEAVNEARRAKRALVVCGTKSTAVAASGQAGAVAGGDPEPRFTWDFVRLYDTAWTGPAGKPVFGDPVAGAPAAAGAASPYGADDLLGVHGENARRAGVCARDLNALMDTIERLQGRRP